MKAFLAALLFVLAQTDSAELSIALNGLRVGTEEFSIVRRGDVFVATGRSEIRVGGATVVAQSRMELDVGLNPLTYEYQSGNQAIRVEVGSGSTRVNINVAGSETSYDVAFPRGGMIVDDNFFHHYILLLDRVGNSGGRVPVFVPQQLTVGTLEVTPSGPGTYDLVTENLRLSAQTDGNGRLVRLVGPEAGVVVER